jgi:AAA ATPase domain
MDPLDNPYAPGAGSPPPELAGRGDIRHRAGIHIARLQRGKSVQSLLLIGLRGVGKTVLLNAIRGDAAHAGAHVLQIEALEDRSLLSLLAPQLRLALLRLNRIEAARETAVRGLRALAGFVGKMKVKYADIEVGLDYEPEPGLADNGNLEIDLAALLEAVGEAAQKAGSALVICVDEIQYVPEPQLAALVTALHRCSQLQLPVAVFGAGLPQLRGKLAEAKSYSERLFEYAEVGPLARPDAEQAIAVPARQAGADVEPAAVGRIVEETQGYPYFLQAWGKTAWDLAEASPITLADVENASRLAIAAMDESFFRARFDRLVPSEKQYLRAMAELGPGPHRSGAIASMLGKRASSIGKTRADLIAKGMVWSPTYGETAFTVPLFDGFMKRIMPQFSTITSG